MTQRFVYAVPFTALFACLFVAVVSPSLLAEQHAVDRPNILFAFADDWGTHAGAYGTKGIETPNFDRIAEEGVLFENAYAPSPLCTPSRSAVLTGQHIWRLGPGANLRSTLPAELPVYPRLLESQADYFVGHTGKPWAPGRIKPGGRKKRPAGPGFNSFDQFLKRRPDDQPFCFWFGAKDAHRPYSAALRKKMGIDPSEVEVPAELPDSETVRKDIADYYAEVQRFDRRVGRLIDRLRKAGELGNTIVVVSGDHGWPFPRGKSNLYDAGTHVPLAIRWPQGAHGGRTVRDFVSLIDLAPTFLEAAGLEPPEQMNGRTLMRILRSKREGRVTAHRSHVITAEERHHNVARPGGTGYPCRAIRTEHFLYIRNYKPDRWPAGSPYVRRGPHIFAEQSTSSTLNWMMAHANEKGLRRLFRLSFGKRPAHELYDLRKDPGQVNNVADKPEYKAVREHLAETLRAELRAMEDPRAFGRGEIFNEYPFYGEYRTERVEPPESVKKALNLPADE